MRAVSNLSRVLAKPAALFSSFYDVGLKWVHTAAINSFIWLKIQQESSEMLLLLQYK